MTMMINTPISYLASNLSPSDFDVYDLIDNRRTQADQDEARSQHQPATVIAEQQADIIRIDHGQEQRQHNRQTADDVACDTSLGGQHANLAFQLDPFADR